MPSAHLYSRKCGTRDKERGPGDIHTDVIITAALILDGIVKKKSVETEGVLVRLWAIDSTFLNLFSHL